MTGFRRLARRSLFFINKLLGLLRLKLVPTTTPTRDFGTFFRHMSRNGIEFKTVIDVGVAFGTPALYRNYPDAKFFLVEPVPECAPILKRLATTLNAEVFPMAAGATEGSVEFFVHTDISGSSRFRQWEGELMDGRVCSVPVRRLDSLVKLPLARPCLLKIDTQGAELEVLEG